MKIIYDKEITLEYDKSSSRKVELKIFKYRSSYIAKMGHSWYKMKIDTADKGCFICDLSDASRHRMYCSIRNVITRPSSKLLCSFVERLIRYEDNMDSVIVFEYIKNPNDLITSFGSDSLFVSKFLSRYGYNKHKI